MKNTPPKHLTPAGRKLWLSIFEENEMDAAALLLLNTLAEQFDRMTGARELLVKDGVVVKDRFGQMKAHPGVAVEANAAAGMMRAWRLLGFDQQVPGAIGRPAGS